MMNDDMYIRNDHFTIMTVFVFVFEFEFFFHSIFSVHALTFWSYA